MQKKDIKFVLNKNNGIIVLNLSFVLFLAKIDFIIKKQDYNKDALIFYDFKRIKIIFALSTTIYKLYI